MGEFLTLVGIVILICVFSQIDDCSRRSCISECVQGSAVQACEELCR